LQVWEAADGDNGLRLARKHRPNVILLDMDAEGTNAAICEQYADQANLDASSLVLLGTARRAPSPSGEFVSKPYHYAPLVRKIEALLEQATRGRRAA
jgi:DNA-binding response OmpR family regulator